jgi:hypothetical protein
MRFRAFFVLALALAPALGSVHLVLAQASPRSSAVLARARAAIGVVPGGPGLRSVRLEGTQVTTQAVTMDQRAGVVRSTDLAYSLIVEAVLPDSYVVTTGRELADGDGQRQFRDTLDRGRLTRATRQVGVGASPWETRESSEALAEARQVDFARLALGVFARADVLPAAVARDVSLNGVQVQATVGTRSFTATLDLDPVTGLPTRQTWRTRMQVYPRNAILGRIGESDGGAGPVDPSTRPEVEVVMVFSDHRMVGGFRLPFRITRSSGGVVLAEMRFTKVEVNSSDRAGRADVSHSAGN